jgi:hypothetical protein
MQQVFKLSARVGLVERNHRGAARVGAALGAPREPIRRQPACFQEETRYNTLGLGALPTAAGFEVSTETLLTRLTDDRPMVLSRSETLGWIRVYPGTLRTTPNQERRRQ